jgi:hypothetical protein
MRNNRGKYMYGLIEAREDKKYSIKGVAGEYPIYTIRFSDIGALVSDVEEDVIKVTVDGCILHEKVLKEVMEELTILPFEFGTVSPGREEVVNLLKENYLHIKRAIGNLRDKCEINVKASWADMKKIFQEIVSENRDIALYKKEIEKKPPSETYEDRIRIGQLVAQALYVKKEKEMDSIVNALKRESFKYVPQRIMGESMILNAAFLIRSAGLKNFENALHKLDQRLNNRMNFIWSDPLPPYNFTSLKLKVRE